MASLNSLIKLVLLPLFCSCLKFKFTTSQQAYSSSACRGAPSSAGYVCNGLDLSCETYIIFPAHPPYTSAIPIASLLGSNASQIGLINHVSSSHEFLTDEKGIVPVDCACSGYFYQSNTSYVVQSGSTPYGIATHAFQGLTTCKAIQDSRDDATEDIFVGEKLVIPLRCACPTENQSNQGINYLITYAVQQGDSISSIAVRFDADVEETLQANDRSVNNSFIQVSTTLLIPLRKSPYLFSMHYDPVVLCIT